MGNNVGLGDSVVSDLPDNWRTINTAGGLAAVTERTGRYHKNEVHAFGDTIRICEGEDEVSAPRSVVLAVLDAKGLNTTANELRKELDALREKLKRVEAVADEMNKNAIDAACEEDLSTTDEYRFRMGGRCEAFSESENMLREALKT